MSTVKTDPFEIPKHINRRIDLPPEAYAPRDNESKYEFPKRAGFNTSGTDIKVAVNQFRVLECANVDVFQYDVSLSPAPPHSVVYKKIWASKAAQAALGKHKGPWLHDGKALAWSTNNVERIIQKIDLGEEGGKPGRPSQMFTLNVTRVSKIRLEVLGQYLQGKMPWNTNVLECMNCLDHILRQGPSEKFKLIKRTLFNQESPSMRLGLFVEAVKGVYSAIRMTESVLSGGLGLGINVDVSNQSFWIGQPMLQLIRDFLANSFPNLRNIQNQDLVGFLKPKMQGNKWVQSEYFKALKRLQRLRFVTTHNSKDPREYAIAKFTFDPVYEGSGANAKMMKFKQKTEDGKERIISVYEYYLERYGRKIGGWELPLIQTGKGGLFPIETCEVKRLNPYPFKLDPMQTQEMIKFAVQRPPQRKEHIMRSVALLNWGEDKYLRAFGMKISNTMPVVKAKLIKNPEISFKNKKCNPGTAGRWDLRGFQFAQPNTTPLKSWGLVVLQGSLEKPPAANFVAAFKKAYMSHGGKIDNDPMILEWPSAMAAKPILDKSYAAISSKFNQAPQIIFFVLRSKEAGYYENLKRVADCYYGVATQMLQALHARKAAPQYCSNLAMKVNSKLGGSTSVATTPLTPNTCFVGVDVSHGAPGQDKASIASMCLSMDKNATYYQGRVETNGWRVEILKKESIRRMLGPMIDAWVKQNQNFPQNLFYLRDGVAEGQFVHVLEHEIPHVKEILNAVWRRKFPNQNAPTKITVIVATKRHHIRFFPERGDKNGNPLPGTLVDREITHPFQYDFYLCSHVAIQGTARPVHYTVIKDEIKMKPDDLQRMIYHQCYQYCRSTTPVSLHPAVYYAHLAGNRGRPHEQAIQTTTESKAGGNTATSKNKPDPSPVISLASNNTNAEAKQRFLNSMWYV